VLKYKEDYARGDRYWITVCRQCCPYQPGYQTQPKEKIKLRIGVYAGSFDPITNGHVDLLERSSPLFDKIIVAVVHNVYKQPLFTQPERIEFIADATRHLQNIEIDCFSGLLVDYLQEKEAGFIIRGLRSFADFEYETTMSMFNKALLPEVETIFMMSKPDYVYISSTGVKEAALLGGDVSKLVPDIVAAGLKAKCELRNLGI
jgi:pantetheine-phosphate adenylyltransferase